METFKPGTRVKIVSPSEPEYDGLLGTVNDGDMESSIGEKFAYVIFDNGDEDTVPYEKLEKVETTNECKGIHKMKKIIKESTDEITLNEIEDMYGKEIKDALVKYCEIKTKSPADIVNDLHEDKNGMTAWDKFDVWCKAHKIDVMQKFGDFGMDDALDDIDHEEERERKNAKRRMKRHDKGLSEFPLYTGGQSVDEGMEEGAKVLTVKELMASLAKANPDAKIIYPDSSCGPMGDTIDATEVVIDDAEVEIA